MEKIFQGTGYYRIKLSHSVLPCPSIFSFFFFFFPLSLVSCPSPLAIVIHSPEPHYLSLCTSTCTLFIHFSMYLNASVCRFFFFFFFFLFFFIYLFSFFFFARLLCVFTILSSDFLPACSVFWPPLCTLTSALGFSFGSVSRSPLIKLCLLLFSYSRSCALCYVY